MSDYIRKEDVLKGQKTGTFANGICFIAEPCVTVKYIESLEPADVVQVVRCKECKYWDPGYPTYYGDDFIVPKCGKYQQMVGYSSDDFCSYGERREE